MRRISKKNHYVSTIQYDMEKWDGIVSVSVCKDFNDKELTVDVTIEKYVPGQNHLHAAISSYLEKVTPRRWTYSFTYA